MKEYRRFLSVQATGNATEKSFGYVLELKSIKGDFSFGRRFNMA